MTDIGYIRVSKRTQELQMQRDALAAAGVEKVFEDSMSGRKTSRPGLEDLFAYARPGDVIVVYSLSRLGRGLAQIINTAARIGKAGLQLRATSQAIDTTTPYGRFFFHLIASLDELEIDIMRERTVDGLASAKRQGRLGGRPSKMSPQDVLKALKLLKQNLGHVEVARRLKVSRTTLYRGLRRGAPQLDTEQQDLLRDVLKSAKG